MPRDTAKIGVWCSTWAWMTRNRRPASVRSLRRWCARLGERRGVPLERPGRVPTLKPAPQGATGPEQQHSAGTEQRRAGRAVPSLLGYLLTPINSGGSEEPAAQARSLGGEKVQGEIRRSDDGRARWLPDQRIVNPQRIRRSAVSVYSTNPRPHRNPLRPGLARQHNYRKLCFSAVIPSRSSRRVRSARCS